MDKKLDALWHIGIIAGIILTMVLKNNIAYSIGCYLFGFSSGLKIYRWFEPSD